MSIKRRTAGSLVAAAATVGAAAGLTTVDVGVPGTALAQSDSDPGLQAQAFRTGSGTPTLRFRETTAGGSATSTPRIFQMEVGRPERFSVRVPPGGRTLGTLEYRTADNQRVRVALRRRKTLLNRRYMLVDSGGVQLVMATRSSGRSKFLTMVANSRISDVRISFRGSGTNLFDVRGRCTSQRFTGRFRLRGDTNRDNASLSSRSLRRAGLC